MKDSISVNETNTITLGIYDRINIPELLPKQSSFEVGIVLRDLRRKLDITQSELSEYSIVSAGIPGGGVSVNWNELVPSKEFELTAAEYKQMRESLVTASKQNSLPTDERMLDLYEYIVSGKERTKDVVGAEEGTVEKK